MLAHFPAACTTPCLQVGHLLFRVCFPCPAQAMGLKVVRVWGFNDAFPYAPGTYSDKQGRGLDYVIAAAGRRGIRVELALANFWNGAQGA